MVPVVVDGVLRVDSKAHETSRKLGVFFLAFLQLELFSKVFARS